MFEFEPIPSIDELKLLVSSLDSGFRVLDDDISRIFTIHKDRLPIAIIEFYDWSYINWFEVFPEFRKQGYGKSIINFLLSQYDPSITSCVFLTPLDEKVKQFWVKCGFSMSTNPPKMKYEICKNIL